MKKVYVLTFILVIAVFTANAQIKAGAGLSYGTEVEKTAITLKGMYGITDAIDASADFMYFFPETAGDYTINYMAVNADGHYNFELSEALKAYGLAGLNLGISSASNGETTSDSSVGFNVGAGGTYGFSDALHGLVEAKYVIKDGSQLVLTAGVLYTF